MNASVQPSHPAQNAPFGSVLTTRMSVAWFKNGAWGPAQIQPVAPIPLHPASHDASRASRPIGTPMAASMCSGWTATSPACSRAPAH